MPRIASAIKALQGALEKEEILTPQELSEIHSLLAQLVTTMVPLESDESSSGEDVSSEECSSEDEDEDSDSGESESSERRSYKKGPRRLGYELYVSNGGTREKWSKKSDKYKDNYYARKNKN